MVLILLSGALPSRVARFFFSDRWCVGWSWYDDEVANWLVMLVDGLLVHCRRWLRIYGGLSVAPLDRLLREEEPHGVEALAMVWPGREPNP